MTGFRCKFIVGYKPEQSCQQNWFRDKRPQRHYCGDKTKHLCNTPSIARNLTLFTQPHFGHAPKPHSYVYVSFIRAQPVHIPSLRYSYTPNPRFIPMSTCPQTIHVFTPRSHLHSSFSRPHRFQVHTLLKRLVQEHCA